MEIAVTKRQWKVSDKQLETYSVEKLETLLATFNQMLNGQFYIVDYYRQKIIVSSPYAPILCGYPRNIAEKEGFGFFSRILKQEELGWIQQMNASTFNFCFQQPIDERESFEVSYDLTVETRDGKSRVLHHKVMPYQLCKNGNVWLGLCYAMASASERMTNKAVIIHKKTGKKYDFIDGGFTSSNDGLVTPEEIQVLKWMAQGLPDKHICSLLNDEVDTDRCISLNTFNARKRRLFKKLEVGNSAAAVHKAHLMGLI